MYRKPNPKTSPAQLDKARERSRIRRQSGNGPTAEYMKNYHLANVNHLKDVGRSYLVLVTKESHE